MTIDISKQNNEVIFSLKGRLDTTTYSDFETSLSPYLDKPVNIILDLEELEYLSSAGLRVILRSHQALEDADRCLIIKKCNEDVMEIFEMAGFVDFLTFE